MSWLFASDAQSIIGFNFFPTCLPQTKLDLKIWGSLKTLLFVTYLLHDLWPAILQPYFFVGYVNNPWVMNCLYHVFSAELDSVPG